ncbi:10574_t:CDS:2 [Paraglomus brasilianum]|uniref:10574_t:CDS:1 n=1 Tax=Paraglomus brasilianum TaxID=144538 RepID=A0A9N9DY55_9GLOM|nr:10574_t:CDS:2 [Paraglomus brasilianum]
MNCEISRTTKLSPYELVFGRSPHKDRVLLDELFESGVTEEILARDSVDIESNDEIEDEDISANAVLTSNTEADDAIEMEDVREMTAPNVNASDGGSNFSETLFEMPGEYGYTWDEYRQLLTNVFGIPEKSRK